MLLTLLSKPGCHLCDRAKDVIERCRGELEFEFEVRDISTDPELLAQYQNDIPVILLDGREIARHFIRERRLRAAIPSRRSGL